MRKIFLYTLTLVLCAQISLSQSRELVPQKVDEVDSVSQRIDSLISKNAFISFSISSINPADSSKYTRQYYVDPKNSCVVKCIIDTSFEDFDKTRFKQLIIYFYKGHEFNTLWIETQSSGIGLGTSLGDFLKDNKESGGIGKLKKDWTKQSIDAIMRQHIYFEIANMKFMQSRNFGN